MAYTPPFDPLNPPKGVITVTDKAPGSLFNPTLSNSHRYLLKCPAARTRPVIINGGGDVVLKGLHLTLHTAVGEMV